MIRFELDAFLEGLSRLRRLPGIEACPAQPVPGICLIRREADCLLKPVNGFVEPPRLPKLPAFLRELPRERVPVRRCAFSRRASSLALSCKRQGTEFAQEDHGDAKKRQN